MKCGVCILLTILFLLVSCTPAPAATTVPVAEAPALGLVSTTASADIPTSPATLTQTATPTHTLVPTETPTKTPTPTDTLTPTSTPTSTPPPKLAVSFYRLRIEYATTSDWTTLELDDAAHVLTARLISVVGAPSYFEAGTRRLVLNQPLSVAEQGQSVGIIIDIALSSDSLDEPLEFRLEKGALNGSIVRVLSVTENGTQLIREVSHQIVVKSNTDFNPLAFSVDLSSLRDVPPLQAQLERPAVPKMLWAFYYPWYSAVDWSSAQLKDHPITRYSSADRRTIARHIEQAQGAGIDGFISSWWGPGSETDQNLRLLLDLAQERGFSVTIYLETLMDSGPRNQAELLRWLTYAISTYRNHPAFMRVDGKPLIVIWASGSVPLATWATVFAELRLQGLDAAYLAMSYKASDLEVFDGLHDYAVFAVPDLVETYRSTAQATRYFSLLSDAPTPKIWVATTQPGYDDRLIPGRTGLFRDRDGGQFYRDTFEAALASDPDWIFITSWNEWWEHTHIEPSELCGDKYLEITQEYAQMWKGE